MNEKTIPNVILNRERLNVSPAKKLGTRQRRPTFTSAVRHKREIKRKKIEKEKVKLPIQRRQDYVKIPGKEK